MVVDSTTYTLTITRASTPARPSASVAGTHRIGAGWKHTVALKSDGTVYSWGTNSDGQLGNGNTSNSTSAVQVKTNSTTYLTSISLVSATKNHSAALTSTGNVYTWGDNTYGQLGIGTSGTDSSYAVQVKTDASTYLTGITYVVAGGDFNVALKSDGTVWSWGAANYGQTGQGNQTNSSYAQQVKIDASTNLTGVVAIASGLFHSLALKNDGTVYAWGYNSEKAAGNGTSTSSAQTYAVQVAGLSNIISIAAGGGTVVTHSAAVSSSGSVYTWGSNVYWMLAHGATGVSSLLSPGAAFTDYTEATTVSGVTKVAANYSNLYFIKSNGTVLTTGDHGHGQRGDGSAVSASRGNCSSDNTISYCQPVAVVMNDASTMPGIAAVVSGYDHVFAITSAGNFIGWGCNQYNQLSSSSTSEFAGAINITLP